MKTRSARVMVIVVLSIAGAATVVSAQEPRIPSDTFPSGDVTLSFVRSGRVGEIQVEEGQDIADGTVLVRLDDAAEQIQLAQFRADAENDVQLRAAEAQLAHSRILLRRTEEMHRSGAAQDLEVEEARLSVLIDELKLELARFNQEQSGAKYREASAQVERMQIRSPIEGRIERVFVRAGEGVDAQARVVRVVRIDPLWIDVNVPEPQGRRLARGDIARIVFEDDPDNAIEGRVLHRSSVATGAIPRVLRVRVEVPNPQERPAGQRVLVSFDPAPSVPDVASTQAATD